MAKLDAQFRQTLATAFDRAIEHLSGLEQSSVAATVDRETLSRRFRKPLTAEGVAPQQVIDELVKDVDGGILGFAGGRFFGWVVGGSLPAALAADWLTATWDQNAVLYSSGPAAALVEEVVGEWLKEILALPVRASFALVSGCQMAHATCLAAARHSLLAERGWDVHQQGLYGAPKIRILANGQRHGSVERAVRLLGMGLDQIKSLATDRQGRVQPAALEEAFERDSSSPTILVLQAGDINTGAFDAFEILIPVARRHGAWVHMDGAFGLWAAASPRYRHLTAGAVKADSWATDGHKWLNVPFDCGYAIVADREAHRAAMSHHATYLTHAEGSEVRDPFDWNPEWSRRARGFPSYAALRQLGRNGIADLVERCCGYARELVTGIGNLPGVKVLSEPIINQGLLRFVDPKPGASDRDHDRRTDEVIAAIAASGEAFFTGSTWNGIRVMRVSVCNWQTTESDVQRAIAAVATVLERMRAGQMQASL